MRIFKKIFILAALSLTVLAGCSVNDYKQLKLKSYDIASVTNFNYAKASVTAEVVLNLGVENPTRSEFVLESLEAVIYNKDGSRVADATALEPAVVLPHSDTLVPLRLDATIFNPMLVMISGNIDPTSMTADIDALVRSGALSKRIQKEKYPLSKLVGKIQK